MHVHGDCPVIGWLPELSALRDCHDECVQPPTYEQWTGVRRGGGVLTLWVGIGLQPL